MVHRGVEGAVPVRFPPIAQSPGPFATRKKAADPYASKVKLPYIGKNLDGTSHA